MSDLMLVSTQNPNLIDKLVALANGDIDLVQQAIRSAAGSSGDADLQNVVEYIVKHGHRLRQGTEIATRALEGKHG